MAIPFEDSINRTTSAPRWTDEKVADLTARDAISSTLRYEGMTVFVVADGKTYQLVGGILDANWKEFGSGGGGANYVDSFTATASQTAFVLTEEPGAKQNIVIITIDGVPQNYASYSIAAKVVTLDTAQPAGAAVEIRYGVPLSLTGVMKLKAPRYTEIFGTASGSFSVNVNTKLLYFEACGPGAPGTGSARGSVNDMGVGVAPGITSFGGSSFAGGFRATLRTGPNLPPIGGIGGFSVTLGPEVTNGWYIDGEAGEHGCDGQFSRGGAGGGGPQGRLGGRGGTGGIAGQGGFAGTGGGGGGGTGEASQGYTGAGGGAGAKGGGWILNPAATIAYVLGNGGTAGTAGTAGYAGGVGGPGFLRIWEFE